MDSRALYIAQQSIWPDPALAYNDVKDMALPKVLEFFGILASVLVVALIIKAFRS